MTDFLADDPFVLDDSDLQEIDTSILPQHRDPLNRRKKSIDLLLERLLDAEGSDLHLAVGSPPMTRIHGQIYPLPGYPDITAITDEYMHAAIFHDLLGDRPEAAEEFRRKNEFNMAYILNGVSRFRVNIFRQKGHYGVVLRVIPLNVPQLDQLGVPGSLARFADMPRGFVLVTGPTGSGKSTTLAGIVDLINRKHRHHVMTMEDPIEFVHTSKKSLINQREIGEDTDSFADALRNVLRQDPDVILLGEMRDPETISTAITAAETGHLVFATLHTTTAASTVDRIIDTFPGNQQNQIRAMLAASLQGIVCQTLCKSFDGKGRVPAAEILMVTPAVRNIIREGKTEQIATVIQTTMDLGSQSLDYSLATLVQQGRISISTAQEKCSNLDNLAKLLHSMDIDYVPGENSASIYH